MTKSIPREVSESDASGVSPEEVLLQITLAFMVFLGFMVSDEVVNKTALQYQVDGLERSIADPNNRGLLPELTGVRLIEQKYELLEDWWKQKGNHPLFRLTAFFYGDPNSPLYKSPVDSLRTNDSFKELHQISNRLFGGRSEANLQGEINSQVEAVTRMSKEQLEDALRRHQELNRRITNPAAKTLTQLGEVRNRVLQPESLAALKQEIAKDLRDQKAKIGQIQCKAFSRLLDANVQSWSLRDLEQVISEWNKDLPMLPEVRKTLERTALMSPGRE